MKNIAMAFAPVMAAALFLAACGRPDVAATSPEPGGSVEKQRLPGITLQGPVHSGRQLSSLALIKSSSRINSGGIGERISLKSGSAAGHESMPRLVKVQSFGERPRERIGSPGTGTNKICPNAGAKTVITRTEVRTQTVIQPVTRTTTETIEQ